MDPAIHRGELPIEDVYRTFGHREAAGVSAVYAEWAERTADDAEVLERLRALPSVKRQPNLVFAAARRHGAHETYPSFRNTLLTHWDTVRATIMSHSTQTNEAARCAVFLPFLAQLPQPLALIEVGASAGLCLLPDRYSYRYSDGTSIDPHDGPADVVIECDLSTGIHPPKTMPQVSWRAGIDINPIDVTDPEMSAWLETLIWPGQQARRDRLHHALDIARQDPPRITAGDLLAELPALAAQAPKDATLIIFHSAVLPYIPAADRAAFVDLVTTLPGHWLSNEGRGVVPGVTLSKTPDARFTLAVDGIPVALTDPHGRSIRPFR